jgi:hypothetical protein
MTLFLKPFPLILMYLPIDYNCFDNQLYHNWHKTKIICKKRAQAHGAWISIPPENTLWTLAAMLDFKSAPKTQIW